MGKTNLNQKSKTKPQVESDVTVAEMEPDVETTYSALSVLPQTPQLKGSWSRADIATPYLTIVQKQGQFFDSNPAAKGQFLYDKDTVLGTEIRVIFCRMAKYFVEKLPFGSANVAPQRFETEEAASEAVAASVEQAKLARQSNARVIPAIMETQEVAEIDLLIEVDKKSPHAKLAYMEFKEKAYLPAKYTVRSTAYGATVKILLKDMQSFLKGDLASHFYKLSSVAKAQGGNSWYAPLLKVDGALTSELREFVRKKAMI